MKSCLLVALIALTLPAGCVAVAPTPAPSPTAAVTIGPELPPTPTALPPTPVPAGVLTPTIDPRITPTVPTEPRDIIAAVIRAGGPRVHGSFPAPDGAWQAQVVIYDCVQLGEVEAYAYEQLVLTQADGGDRVVVDSQLQSCGGLGASGLDLLFWSPTGRYFFYTNAREGIPDGCGYWERPFIRVDTTDWRTEYLGGGPRSPDGKRIATWHGRTLLVWDVEGGEIGRVTAAEPDLPVGPIAWSPDSQALVFVQVGSFCPLRGPSVVTRVDLPALGTLQLARSDLLGFSSVEWETPEAVRLLDADGQAWSLDLASQELRPVP